MLLEMFSAGIEKMFMVRIGNCNVSDDPLRYKEMIKWQNKIVAENENVIINTKYFRSSQ